MIIETCICTSCIRDGVQSSLSSLPSCGRLALSDHRIRTAICRHCCQEAQSGLSARPLKTCLLPVVTALSLRKQRGLASLVLRYLVRRVLSDHTVRDGRQASGNERHSFTNIAAPTALTCTTCRGCSVDMHSQIECQQQLHDDRQVSSPEQLGRNGDGIAAWVVIDLPVCIADFGHVDHVCCSARAYSLLTLSRLEPAAPPVSLSLPAVANFGGKIKETQTQRGEVKAAVLLIHTVVTDIRTRSTISTPIGSLVPHCSAEVASLPSSAAAADAAVLATCSAVLVA